MAFPQSFLEELSARSPIEEIVGQYVQLTRRGANLFGLCPFHSEKTGSFSVAPEKGLYYCFGCHKGGGAVNFIMEIENLEYGDAVRFLAKRAGMEVPEDDAFRSQYKRQERLWALMKDAARHFHAGLLSESGKQAREYITGRGLSAQTVTRFGLGFAPDQWSDLVDAMTRLGYEKQELLDAGLALKSDKGRIYDRFRNRLMFPIIDVRGNIIAFGGRVMDNSTPKYLNSPETVIFNKRKNLFALNVSKKSKQGRLILTEGYMDAISLHQYGFDCAVASLGTSLTEEQARLMAKYTDQVVLTYDGDEAGQNATRRAIPMLEKAGLQVRVLKMQGAKDPDEFLKKFGAERFRLLLDGSQSQAEYRLEAIRSKYRMDSDEERVAFLKSAAQMIATLGSAVEREVYGARAAEAAGITPEAMRLEITKAFRRRKAEEEKKEERVNLSPAETLQSREREFRYADLRSAMAEEQVLRMVLQEESLFSVLSGLTAEQFSAPLLGKAFRLLEEQYARGTPVSLAALEGALSKEEMQRLTEIVHREGARLVNEDALRDCVSIIREEAAKRDASAAGDLMALRERLKERKGLDG